MVLTYKPSFDIIIESILVHVADWNRDIAVIYYTHLGNFLYLAQVDYIRTVHTHKHIGWQNLLYLFHTEQRDYRFGLALNKNAHIFAHTLHIHNGVKRDTNYTVIRLDK